MTGFDATFLALACSFLVKPGERRSLTALVPLAAYFLQLLPNATVQVPLIAVAVIALSGPQLAAAAILAMPDYGTFYEAAAAAILWWTLCELMDVLEGGHGPRVQHTPDLDPDDPWGGGESQALPQARLSLKVMVVGVLYLILYPLALL